VPEETAEELYEHAPCGYLSTRPDGTIVRANRTFLEWTGYAHDDLASRRRFQDLLSPGGRIYHETHLAPLLRMQDHVRAIALELVTAEGARIPVLVTATLRRDDEGEPAGIRTLVFDATDRRRYEEELLRARRAEGDARARVERLQELTATLATGLHSAQIAAAAVEQLARRGEARAAVAVIDRPETQLHVLAAEGWSPAALEAWSAHTDLPSTDRPAHVVVLPMTVAGREQVGALLLGYDDAAPTEEEHEFLRACAAQCAQALERARLHEQTALAAERAALIADMSQALEEARDLDHRLRTLIEVVVPALGDGARATFAGPGEAAPLVAATGAAEAGGGTRESVRLGVRGHAAGRLEVVRSQRRQPFDPGERAFLVQIAERAALALETARLYEQERDAARTLQRSFLTGHLPADPRVRIATRYLPAVQTLEVGGDWYDAFVVARDRLGVVVGDVVGRGLEAATAMGQLRSAVRALAVAELEPAGVLDRLDAFVAPVEAAQMATLAYAEIALDTGRACLAMAGHPPPVLLAPGEEPQFVWKGRSTPIGVVTGRPREQVALQLEPGTRLLLYTDGLIERRGESLDRGFERLLAEVGRQAEATPEATVRELTADLLADGPGEDDVSLLYLAYAGGAGERR
jgi:serine/threonine-protein kinase RsbW